MLLERASSWTQGRQELSDCGSSTEATHHRYHTSRGGFAMGLPQVRQQQWQSSKKVSEVELPRRSWYLRGRSWVVGVLFLWLQGEIRISLQVQVLRCGAVKQQSTWQPERTAEDVRNSGHRRNSANQCASRSSTGARSGRSSEAEGGAPSQACGRGEDHSTHTVKCLLDNQQEKKNSFHARLAELKILKSLLLNAQEAQEKTEKRH